MSYESYSRHAEIWGWFSGDRSDEIDCWATLAKRYGVTVLAAMAATGEVAAALAGRGFKVTAVDICHGCPSFEGCPWMANIYKTSIF